MHGTPLTSAAGVASPNVNIGKLQAWRTIDFHVCPLTTPSPHTGGQVPLGSPTIRINGLSAARHGDTIVEAGPSNAIAMGSPTIQVR